MSFYLKKYMWLISLIAVIFCSYFLAKVTANFIAMQFEGGFSTPSIKQSEEVLPFKADGANENEDYQPIIERNIFDSRDVQLAQPETVEGEPEEVETNPTGEAVLTNLKIKLISTFSVGEGLDERSTCIISSGEKDGQEVYTVNDAKEFAPQTKIVKVAYNRVEFLNKGRLEYVDLEDFAQGVAMNVPPKHDEPAGPETDKEQKRDVKIEKTGEGSFVIDRSEIDDAVNNLDKLYTQVRAVPHFQEGRPNGLKLLSVKSGSIFSKLGLQRGDILKKINGLELDIKRGLEIFNRLKSESSITIDLDRRGKPETFEYEIR